MPKREQLNVDERYKVIRIEQSRYQSSSRAEKSALLDHLVALTGLHRKTVTRLLSEPCKRRPRRRQRGRSYGGRVDDALRVISEAHNFACAELLQPNLVEMAEILAQHRELQLDGELRQELRDISVSTIRRHLERIYQDVPRLRRRSSGTSSLARSLIPTTRIPWSEREPGHFEVDLVHHCGSQVSGEYVYSLMMVDVATSWLEPAALLGRSGRAMVDAFARCERRLPFPVLEVHSDNGSEFFVAHVLRYWQERADVPFLSRSRPYRKNDNRFVEHRNGTVIRAWIGNDRLDTAAQTIALNRIYGMIATYHNFCQPVMRLQAKVRTESGQVRRRYDSPRTPYQRLLDTEVLSAAKAQELEQTHAKINPRALRADILKAIDGLFRLPMATGDVSEDVFATLLTD